MEFFKKIGAFFSRFDSGYFLSDPKEFQFNLVLLAIFILLFATVIFLRISLGRKIERKDPRFSLLRSGFWYFLIVVIFGLILVFFRTQELPGVTKRVFLYLDFVLILVGAAFFNFYLKKKMPEKVTAYLNKKRKEKWLK